MQTGRPPMGAGPMAVPSANPGDEARSIAILRQVVEQLQKVLPDMQVGSDPHNATLNAIKSLSRYATAGASDPNNQQVQLRQLMQSAGKDAMTQQVMQNLQAGAKTAGGAPPGAAPGAGASPLAALAGAAA